MFSNYDHHKIFIADNPNHLLQSKWLLGCLAKETLTKPLQFAIEMLNDHKSKLQLLEFLVDISLSSLNFSLVYRMIYNYMGGFLLALL